MNEHEDVIMCAAVEEIKAWRHYFIERKFSTNLKHISEKHKNLLRDYFLNICAGAFCDPEEAWDACISCLLQTIENKNI